MKHMKRTRTDGDSTPVPDLDRGAAAGRFKWQRRLWAALAVLLIGMYMSNVIPLPQDCSTGCYRRNPIRKADFGV